VQVHVTMVTGVHHNEQPSDLEAGEGARTRDSWGVNYVSIQALIDMVIYQKYLRKVKKKRTPLTLYNTL
jgi:hypothetical protein